MTAKKCKTDINIKRKPKGAPHPRILPEGYAPLPGVRWTRILKEEAGWDIEKISDPEPGKCLVCGSSLAESRKFSENVVCSQLCLTALQATGGYLEPDTDGLQRCPKCGIRMLSSLDPSAHCGNWPGRMPGKEESHAGG